MKFNIYACGLLLPISILASCNSDSGDEPETPTGFRPVTATSSAFQNKVYDYIPAPGQFINETKTGGFTGAETTPAAANEWAIARLLDKKTVSLGSFGGYIVVGFDHSIAKGTDGYDFAVLGNQLDSSNEPGIVWVMKDENHNGLPDDRWYQLRGSETGLPSTKENYSVTYYRPDAACQPVKWRDSDGNEGTVDYLKAYHKQDYYYPAWITADSYTLTGTRLEARNSQNPATGQWTNPPFSWGYADNLGSDTFGEPKLWNGFKISNAIDSDGNPADLDYIDFVKIQTGVLTKSGWLGESSTEVAAVADARMM